MKTTSFQDGKCKVVTMQQITSSMARSFQSIYLSNQIRKSATSLNKRYYLKSINDVAINMRRNQIYAVDSIGVITVYNL